MRNEKIVAGSRWRHFKGSIMEVVCIAINSETLEEMVIYNHDNNVWVRPISSFLSDEDISSRNDNKTGQKYRFEEIHK